ncbi:MAG: hypothetical protein D3922_01385 [Candidatus Electrothrix sp. AR1]|nr:hypothetical protein [Candidatus Electrothrix sp. AR1]
MTVLVDDPRRVELQRLVDELGRCNEVGYPLQVNMAPSKDANAFAFPGGRIIVLEGLLETIRSENGLSFVLAHEMAHFKHRDHLRGMGRGLVFTALSALLTGAGSDITQLIAPALGIGQARYSQEREALADKLALETLNCFYGHVGGATDFLRQCRRKLESRVGGLVGILPVILKQCSELMRSVVCPLYQDLRCGRLRRYRQHFEQHLCRRPLVRNGVNMGSG